MSDTPIPPFPDAQQGDEAQPEASPVTGGPDTGDTPEAETPANRRTLEGRLLAFGETGEGLLDVLNSALDKLEQLPSASIIAGTFGLVFETPGEVRPDLGVIAAEFGNDLILKGLGATISEQRAGQNTRRSLGGMPLGALGPEQVIQALRAMRGSMEPVVPVELFKTAQSLCDDPECDSSAAIRAAIGGEPGPAANPEAEG